MLNGKEDDLHIDINTLTAKTAKTDIKVIQFERLLSSSDKKQRTYHTKGLRVIAFEKLIILHFEILTPLYFTDVVIYGVKLCYNSPVAYVRSALLYVKRNISDKRRGIP
jgi:hypothetical protein